MAKKKTAKKEVLVVGSKVKAYLKSKKVMVSGALVEALSDKVYCALDAAVERTKANKRKTVQPQDL